MSIHFKKSVICTSLCVVALATSMCTFASFSIADENHRFFIDLGIERYSAKLDGMSAAATLQNTTTPISQFNPSSTSNALFQLGLGYHFINTSNSFLTRIFGFDESIGLKAEYGSFKGSAQNNFSGNEYTLWYIDGSGHIGPVDKQTYEVKQVNFMSKKTLFSIAFDLSGVRSIGDTQTSFSPAFGLVYSNLTTHDDSTVYFDAGGTIMPDGVQTTLKTNYFGMHFSDGIKWQLSSRIQPFISLDLQLLHAKSSMNVYQQAYIIPPAPQPSPVKNISDSLNKMTYRIIGTLGVDYYFTNVPNSCHITLKGGFDRWGYQPYVEMPLGQKIRLASHSLNNGFFGIDLYVPIG